MEPRPNLTDIPKGNTCDGVNRAVIEHLLAAPQDLTRARVLDLPCGTGGFLETLRRFFPEAVVRGADVMAPPEATDWAQADLSRAFTLFAPLKFDVITSISGVMEFDNTRLFFESCAQHLAEDGLLLVTNDNTFTVRDRLTFLCFGKVRRFHLLVAPGDPTWKMIPVQNLVRSLEDAGFTIESIRYVSAQPKDWMLWPLAAIIWPWQWAHVRFRRSTVPFSLRRAMFPFRALICRHYIVAARRK